MAFALGTRVTARGLLSAAGKRSRRFAAASRVAELRSLEDFERFDRDRSVLYFTAKWCPPCKRIAPVYAELSDEHEDIRFAKCDIDENSEAAEEAGIMSVPTFLFFRGGELVTKFAGADHQLLEETIAKLKEL